MADRNNDSPPPLEDTNKRDNICARNYSEEEDDKNNDGPPPLEDPNSPNYICVVCQNNVNNLCQECQETRHLRVNYTRNYSEEEDDKVSETNDDNNKDTKIPLDIDDESSSYVGHAIDHLDPESPDSSRSNSPEPRSDTDPDDNITN